MARTFRSTILLKCGGKLADARSILSVLLLTASMGAVVDIETTGDDETNAAGAMEKIFSADDDGGPSDQQTPN
jgi:phosphotransferase system HPr (HPr) family protein